MMRLQTETDGESVRAETNGMRPTQHRLASISDEQEFVATSMDWVVPMLRRVDSRLAIAVEQIEAASTAEPGRSDLPGLFITSSDVERLLRSPLGACLYRSEPGSNPLPPLVDEGWRTWGRLQTSFDLDTFDLELLALALSVELDLKYQRIFGWLQDDLTRLRPSIGLAFGLLCQGPEDRMERLAHLDSEAPLIRHGVLRLSADPHQHEPPKLGWYLVPGEGVLPHLLGRTTLGDRLAHFARRVHPTIELSDVPVSDALRHGIGQIVAIRLDHGPSIRLRLRGPEGSGQGKIAESIASALGQPLLIIDLPVSAPDPETVRADLRLGVRYARMHGCVLLLDGMDRLAFEAHGWMESIVSEQLTDFPGVAIVNGSPDGPWFADRQPRDCLTFTIDLPPIDGSDREPVWRNTLENVGIALGTRDIEVLANRYRLLPGQIANAVHTALGIAAWEGSSEVSASVVMNAARRQSYADLHSMAQVHIPDRGWDDIVLPVDQINQLHEICDHVEYRHVIHHQWSRAHRTARPDGLNTLFSGPSGTGKTLAAEIIAGALDLDLATVNIAHTISKYIGETEKNLDRIFTAAEQSSVVLFFDEADAIFGKRSQVKDAHDRYANLEVGYLLQKIENHEGIVILCTNFRSNMDDAFARRLNHVVEFPFPDASLRCHIWQKHLHDRIPQAGDLDLTLLAHQFEITGGSIRSIVLNACVFAAAERQPVSMRHIIRATCREFQKMGRVCDEHTFGEAMRWFDVRDTGQVIS